MDTLLLQKLAELNSLQDSILTHTQKIQETVASIKTESLFLRLLPFIGVIAGGIIAYAGQSIIKNREIKLTTATVISDAVSKIFSNLSKLTFYLKELAYLEVDSKYQYYLACTETGQDKKRALDEHYNDYKYIADMKTKITDAISEIDASFAVYYRLKNSEMPDNTTISLNTFSNHLVNLKRHAGYEIPTSEALSKDEDVITTTVIEKDTARLFEEYNRLTISIRQLASAL